MMQSTTTTSSAYSNPTSSAYSNPTSSAYSNPSGNRLIRQKPFVQMICTNSREHILIVLIAQMNKADLVTTDLVATQYHLAQICACGAYDTRPPRANIFELTPHGMYDTTSANAVF